MQAAAPTPLLIGTDLLPCLGFQLLQRNCGKPRDLLQEKDINNTDAQAEERGKDSHQVLDEKEATVHLLQPTRLPPRHAKLVKVQVQGGDEWPMSLFVPGESMGPDKQLQVQESMVEPDGDQHFIVLMENHTTEPKVLHQGEILGILQEVKFPIQEPVDLMDSERSVSGETHKHSQEPPPTVARVETVASSPETTVQQMRNALRMDCDYLSEEEQQQVDDLVMQYLHVFSLDPLDLGLTDVIEHTIDTGRHPPIKQAARRTPFILRQKIDELTKQMLEAGVVQPSKSPWASPVVLVRKKDGSHRFCVDYRRLNSATKMDVFPLPRIDDTLDMLAKTKYFTTLDLAAGYWQVKMDTNSQEKTAFATHSGLYEFTVMPFGLCNAPATFQRLMEAVLAGIARERCMVYLDDVLVVGKDFQEHLANLKAVFDRLRVAGLKLKPTKCYFGSDQVEYLGYIVSQGGISADPRKVVAIQDFPPPRDVKTLQSFLGLASYYRRFISGFSVVANPLFCLTRKNVEFVWDAACQEAFDRLKELLTQAPVLAFPLFDQGFRLDTDASGSGLGAVLSQQQDDGSVRLIAFASRSLQPHEKNYGVTELEALGVVWAVKHFRPYLYGQTCDVYTDHEALRSLLNTPHPSGKLARWGLALQEVNLTIHYRPGRKNANADALSRSPSQELGEGPQESGGSVLVASVSPTTPSQSGETSLSQRQQEDPDLGVIITYLKDGELPEDTKVARELILSKSQYVLKDGVLFYVAKDKTLCIISPKTDRHALFEEAHSGVFGGHLREAKIHGQLAKHYWWSGMRTDIHLWCAACLACATRGTSRGHRTPLTPIPVAGPFDRVGVDVVQFPKSRAGKQYTVVFVDYLTKWPEVFATKDQTALTIARLFVEHIVSRHGVPSQLLSDRGPAFLSHLMAEVCHLLGVKKVNTTAYHPQTDGLVERFNRTLTAMLSKTVEESGRDWEDRLPFVLFAYRTSLQESTQESPFYLLYGRDPKLPSALGVEYTHPRQDVDLCSYTIEITS